MSDHDEAPLPKWLAWVAWGIGAVALYSVFFGRVTLDALDLEYPRREVVRDGASAGVIVAVEIGPDVEEGAADGDADDVRDALSVLPEMVTQLVQKKNAHLELTTMQAIAESGMEADEALSQVAGYFDPKTWQLKVAHDVGRPGLVALHEVGHFVDAAMGNCATGIEFSKLVQAAAEREELGRHYLSSPKELFAYMFTQYYFSDRRRKRLAREYPDAIPFFEVIASTGACPDPDPID